MLVRLCDELVFLLNWEITFSSNKNSRKSTSRYVYTLSVFLLFL